MQTSHWLTAVGFVALVTGNAEAASPAGSRSGALNRTEREALLAGEVVARPMQFETESGSYRGGVSYSVVNAPAAAVLSALSNVDTLPQALPHTKSARLIDVRGSLARVELVHGDGTTYTVHIERSAKRSELRFWLDSSRPHDISDVYGFFRVEPFAGGKSMVTVAAALDLGPGITSLFFSGAVERSLLSTPGRIRSYVEPRALALLEAPGWSVGF
ncbi:MAG TPA: SRPBCC family protein [Polyangiaceae bacterium]|nr:SRPBCC family protein [Polyangiaceae bacterium]